MISSRYRLYRVFRKCLFVMILIPVISSCIAVQTKARTPKSYTTAVQMTQEELQAAVISYANRFIATIAQASLVFEKELPTPQGRLIASNRRVYSISAIAEIAAGPNPGSSLLDIVVMTTLNRMIWDEYWRPQVFGMPATVIVEAYEGLEADAWSQAAKVMTPSQMEELKDLIINWRLDHPEQFVVDYIRFSDFGDIGRKPNLKQIHQTGGLLAPVKEATQAVDEIRMTSERAMFLLTKIQLIAGFQAELAYKQFLFQPETVNMMNNMDQFKLMAKALTRFFEDFPEQISKEQNAAFDNAADLIAKEREIIVKSFSQLVLRERNALLNSLEGNQFKVQNIIHDVNQTLDRLDKTFAQLQTTLVMTDKLVQGSEKTGKVFTDLVTSVDRIAARFEPKDSRISEKPFDIKDYTDAMIQLQESSEKLNELLHAFNETSNELASSFLDKFNIAAEKRVNHIFIRLVQLCLLIGVIVLAIIIVNNRTKQPKN